jgi:hypothetical protein
MENRFLLPIIKLSGRRTNFGNNMASQAATITVIDWRNLYDTGPRVAVRWRQLSRTLFIHSSKRVSGC